MRRLRTALSAGLPAAAALLRLKGRHPRAANREEREESRKSAVMAAVAMAEQPLTYSLTHQLIQSSAQMGCDTRLAAMHRSGRDGSRKRHRAAQPRSDWRDQCRLSCVATWLV